jgi:hypothetical protein
MVLPPQRSVGTCRQRQVLTAMERNRPHAAHSCRVATCLPCCRLRCCCLTYCCLPTLLLPALLCRTNPNVTAPAGLQRWVACRCTHPALLLPALLLHALLQRRATCCCTPPPTTYLVRDIHSLCSLLPSWCRIQRAALCAVDDVQRSLRWGTHCPQAVGINVLHSAADLAAHDADHSACSSAGLVCDADSVKAQHTGGAELPDAWLHSQVQHWQLAWLTGDAHIPARWL